MVSRMDAENGTFAVYVISVGRWARGVVTGKNLVSYRYVVRKSQEEQYRSNGFGDVLAVEDELINSYGKVFNYLVENAKEDVIAIVDDDIDHFVYRTDKLEDITDPEIVQAELMRLGQIIFDLNIGLCAGTPNGNIYSFNGEFAWSGIPGAWKVVNRRCIKARMDPSIGRNMDIDYVMQENLYNRIVLHERYLTSKEHRDEMTNTTGTVVSKNDIDVGLEKMELKWGKYFKYIKSRNLPVVRIKR